MGIPVPSWLKQCNDRGPGNAVPLLASVGLSIYAWSEDSPLASPDSPRTPDTSQSVSSSLGVAADPKLTHL
jgi:hypothetical protein